MEKITEQDKLNILQTLNSFTDLNKKGWNGYDAAPITSSVIVHSKEVLKHFNYPPDVFPLSYNGVQFEWEDDEYYIELEVRSDNSYHLYCEHNTDMLIELESTDFAIILTKINEILEKMVE